MDPQYETQYIAVESLFEKGGSRNHQPERGFSQTMRRSP